MRKTTLSLLLSSFVISAGCAGGDLGEAPEVAGDQGQSSTGKADSAVPTLYQCWSSTQSYTRTGKWKKLTNYLVAKLGSPRHRMQDVIGTPGSVVTIKGVFSYGKTDKAMEGEKSSLYFDNCGSNVKILDQTTGGDGQVAYNIRLPSVPGVFALHGALEGDGSSATAYAWVLPAGTHFAVSDIDGTLTTSDLEVIKQTASNVFDGGYTPEAYPGASDLTWAEATRGRIPVYLTGRPSMLKTPTSSWLFSTEGMAWGPVHVTDSTAQALPSTSGVGEFKRQFLANLVAQGYKLDIAFGNATTDIYAYAKVGIPVGATYIIGTHAGEGSTHAVDGSWQDLADSEAAASEVAQPFTW